jgi:TRAP-type C4-dicarboxylate transport system permease small subunit
MPPLKALRAASRFLLVAGGLLMVAATVLIVAEIAMRQVFHRSMGGVDELAGFALAVATAWSFAAVLLDKAHVRIDTVYVRFGTRARAVLDIASLGGTVLFVGALVWFGLQVLTASLRFGATSQSSLAIPKAVPQALWLGGLAWFLLVAVILLACCLLAAFRGDWRGVAQLAGAQQVEDELRAELAQVEERGEGLEGARA